MFGKHLRSVIFVVFVSISFFLLLTYREINKSVENKEGVYYSSEIKDTIVIQRNRFSLPRIKVSNEEDLYYSLGKIIAQDRLFQLRLFQIVLNGRYSELIDGSEIKLDEYIKNLNLDALADSLQNHTAPVLLNLLQKYCDGINSTVAEKKMNLSLPFIISETNPVSWTVKDVLKLYSFLTISANLNGDRDFFLSRSKALLTKKQFRFLCQFYEIDYHKVISLAADEVYSVPEKLNEIFPFHFQSSGFPFFSGENYFVTLYTAPVFPAFYYPVLLSKKKILNSGVMIPGLPIMYQNFSSDQIRILSFSDNPEYSLRKTKIETDKIVKEEFSIKTLTKNESNFERVTLENGFALSNRFTEDGKVRYFAFNKKKFYNSFNEYFKICNNDSSRFFFNDTTIFPNMNCFVLMNDTLFSKIVPTEKRRFKEYQQFCENIIKDAVYCKNTENEKFFRIKSGDFLLDYLHQQTDNFTDSLNSHIFQTLLDWDRVAIPESKAFYYFDSLITNLITNVFQDELGSNIDYFLKDRRAALDFIEYILINKSNLFISKTKIKTKEIFNKILIKSIRGIEEKINREQGSIDLIFSHPLNQKKYKKILSVPKIAVNGSEFSFKKVKENLIPAVIFKFKPNKITDIEFSFAGGISGNPLSDYYKNFQKYWEKDIYIDFGVKDSKNGERKLTLIPEK